MYSVDEKIMCGSGSNFRLLCTTTAIPRPAFPAVAARIKESAGNDAFLRSDKLVCERRFIFMLNLVTRFKSSCLWRGKTDNI